MLDRCQGSNFVVELLDAYCDTGRSHVHLVMEYGGENLRALRKRREDVEEASRHDAARAASGDGDLRFAFSATEVRSVVVALASALKHLQEVCGLIHGDLQPGNVLVRNAATTATRAPLAIKVCDMGCCLQAPHPTSFFISTVHAFT